jgi:Sulfotransferase family
MDSTYPRSLRYAGQSNKALATNVAHQFAAAHAMGIYQASAIFSYIPKNACSTMRFSIACANGCIASDEEIHWIHNNNETFRPNIAELATAKYSFVVLRDPFKRVASCYLDKFVGREREAWRFAELLGRRIDLDRLTFREFVKALPNVLRGDQHWRPQVDFLVYRRYDDVFCVEDFSQAVDVLNRKIGFVVKDTRHLLNHGSEQYKSVTSNDGFFGISSYEIANMKRNGEIPAVASMFDEEIIGLVRRMYADDFSIYAELVGKPCLYA